MKQSAKKWTGLLALMLCASLIMSACSSGSGKGGASNSPTSSPGAATQGENEAPIEIVWANNFNAPEADGNYVQTEIEKKFNVKIKNVKLERGTWREQFSVLLAGGDIPDIFPVDANETDMALWADQNIIASLDRAEIEQHMPKAAAAIAAIDEGAWGVGLYKGQNWGIPKLWPNGLSGFLPGYNEAWLKNVGYEAPPTTLEEFEDVLTRFVNEDPDRNGAKDTYGMSARGKLPIQMFTSVFAAYGVSPYQFKLDASGQVVWGGITEDTRQALALLNSWYKKGIIHPEFITSDNNELNTAFVNQKIGVIDNAGWGNFNKNSGYIAKPADEVGINYIPGKPLIGPAGQMNSFTYGARQAPVLLGKQLEKDEKKRLKIYEILEWVSTDKEGYFLTAWGQEGVSYDMEGDFVVGRTEEEVGAVKLGYGYFYNPLGHIETAFDIHKTRPEDLEQKELLNAGVHSLVDVLGPAVMETKSQYWPNLTTLQDTFIIKAITGEANTEGDFDKFKEDWLRSGGQAVTDEANQIYKERQQ